MSHLGWLPLPQVPLSLCAPVRTRSTITITKADTSSGCLPERKVFVDSRQDPYPLSFLLELEKVESGQLPHGPLFARYGIRCSFLSTDSPTVSALNSERWRTTYRDERWAVQVPASPNETLK